MARNNNRRNQRNTNSTTVEVVEQEKPEVVEQEAPVEVEQEKPEVVEQEAPVEVKKPAAEKKGSKDNMDTKIQLINYSEHMNPKKAITADEGANWQASLYRVIMDALSEADNSEFNSKWRTILNHAKEDKDLFNEKWMFRFAASWKGSNEDFDKFRKLVFLIINSYTPAMAKEFMGSCNLEALTKGLTEVQTNNLLSYYE